MSLDQEPRNRLRRTVGSLRKQLENAFEEQLEGTFGILRDCSVQPVDQVPPLAANSELQRRRDEIIAAIEHEKQRIVGKDRQAKALQAYVLESAFTLLNRLVALKLMERRGLVPECVSRGAESEGFKLFQRLAPDVARAQDDAGYRLFLELLFDDTAQEMRLVFDRTLPASHLFPGARALREVLDELNAPELDEAWNEDETLGWVYQYFTPKDLRERIRKESSAPRNTYELAVRNQFYTPDYVVRFLAENTLGRLWWEQHPDTSIATRDFLVRREGERPPARKPQDPRTLRVLDPACGSGHFLHYCFDLLQTIYVEAYDGHPAGESLRESYGSVEELQADLPALILRYNLFGIDIDLRASQLTAVSLYLRAKRMQPNCEIRKVHAIHAAPMPAEVDLLDSYVDSMQSGPNTKLLQHLAREIWEQLDELAGEAGPLLKAEHWIRKRIETLREEWERSKHEGQQLPLGDLAPVEAYQARLDLDRDTTEDFWDRLEPTLLELLRIYVERSEGNGVTRRLFAEDAAHGFAFLDALMHDYDVVLMNPPFGATSKPSKKYIDKTYPRTKNDVYAAFVERGLELLRPSGYLGAITSRTGFFLSSFTKWREKILLQETDIVAFADLGYGVLDTAMVETAAYVLRKRSAEAGTS